MITKNNILLSILIFVNVAAFALGLGSIWMHQAKTEEKTIQMLILNDQESVPPDKIVSYTIHDGVIRIVLKNHVVVTSSHFTLAEE